MKGTNTMVLNPETMLEAMQYWVDHIFSYADKSKVTAVEVVGNNFEIALEEEEEESD